jgi:hypothetical protein
VPQVARLVPGAESLQKQLAVDIAAELLQPRLVSCSPRSQTTGHFFHDAGRVTQADCGVAERLDGSALNLRFHARDAPDCCDMLPTPNSVRAEPRLQ